jgi:hypothetical protein
MTTHTYYVESLLLTTSIPGQLPAAFLSLLLAISHGTWNSNSLVPLPDCKQMDTITTYKAYHICPINPPTAIHQTQNTAL